MTAVLKKSLLTITVWFLQLSALAQTPLIDSLSRAYHSSPTVIQKIAILNELAWVWSSGSLDTALHVAKQAEQLASVHQDSIGLSTSLARQAWIYSRRGNYDSAFMATQKTLAIETQRQNRYGMARAYTQFGILYRRQANLVKAYEYYDQSYHLLKQLDSAEALVSVCLNLGSLHRQLGNYAKSEGFFLEAENLLARQNLSHLHTDKARIYAELGTLNKETKNYNPAIDFQQQALNIYRQLNQQYEVANSYIRIGNLHMQLHQLDSAYYYYTTGISLKQHLGTQVGMAEVLDGLGTYFFQKRMYDSATYYHTQALHYASSIAPVVQASIQNNLGVLDYGKQNYQAAIDHFSVSLQLLDSLGERSFDTYDLLNNLATCYEQLYQFEAANKYRVQSFQLRDSLEQAYRMANTLRIQNEETNHRVTILEKEKSLQQAALIQAKTSNQFKTYILISCLVLFFFLALIFLWRQRTQQARLAQQQSQQQLEQLIQESQMKTYEAMLEGQDAERKRVAQDLHDELGSLLSLAKMNFEALHKEIGGLAISHQQGFEKTEALLQQAVSQVRQIAYELGTEVLEQFGLVRALEDLVKTIIDASGLSVVIIPVGLDQRLPKNLEIPLYKVVSELLTNVVRHARAQEVSIQLLKRNETLRVTVEDDGVGFDYEQAIKKRTMGVKGIQTRIEALHGQVDLDTAPGKGTLVTIEVPITN